MDFTDYTPYLTINGASQHSPAPEFQGVNWNQQNDGIGVKLQKTYNNIVTSWLLGEYDNSLNKQTNYAAGQWQYRLGDQNLHADIGVLAGLATGYRDPVIPVVQPTLTLGNSNMDFNVRYTPHIQGLTPEVYSINMDYRLPE